MIHKSLYIYIFLFIFSTFSIIIDAQILFAMVPQPSMILVSGSGLVRVWVRPRFVFGLVSGFASGSGVWVGVGRFVSVSCLILL